MIIVNRARFIVWAGGILLKRGVDARVFVGDDINHEKAQDAMDAGETIGLTQKGVIVTRMRVIDGAYVEVRV